MKISIRLTSVGKTLHENSRIGKLTLILISHFKTDKWSTVKITEIIFLFSHSSSTTNASENVIDKLDSVGEKLMIIRCRRKANGEYCLEHELGRLVSGCRF